MTTGAVGGSGYTNINDVLGKTNQEAAKSSNKLDQDTFLKLLVAQMKYQDPSNPADATQFLTQTAQFTQVEKLGAIADSVAKLDTLASGQASMLQSQLMLGASNLIGKTVTAKDPAGGADITGVVTSATFGGSTPTLKIGDKDVALSDVKDVRQAAKPS
ncbi:MULTISPECIES: flagellar hook assembly protein FlgD [Catenuloplanes]|uniref:Flagellar basal-body rod modification protein FlgD n=1 Tax=Catenuloplanes niger TaxID=587534 RepID=A0AAE3ZS90_9ACTN|nr:flagellar hook capping FlgD N-terminal domain-containing protein [Catenuloplanes niger]MDR7324017.1 flagellar basal-body rod modification protein FlgD [Catenuloplanes niger]